MTKHTTTTSTLIAALRILARDIESEDGIANSCIAEAANMLEELDALATDVVQAAFHGDQHLIQCLVYGDIRTRTMRVTIVALADWLREH
jgi:hypothetical protein